MLVFSKYFYKKKKSKLYFGDRIAVLNDFIYQTGGSINYCLLFKICYSGNYLFIALRPYLLR
jgi:hypothetical protein